MKAALMYRMAAILLLLFAIGHTLGFRQSDPAWHADAVVGAMQSLHFDIQGFRRSYWDFFEGSGFCVGVFFVFSAILAWQLGGVPAATRAQLRVAAWAFASCFVAIAVLSWLFLFAIPIAFSTLIAASLTVAAYLSRTPDESSSAR